MPDRYHLNPPAQNVVETFETACAELGLRVHRGSLATHPESTHWHLTIPKQKGTLEATWQPPNNTLWLDIRSNRKADWMEPVVRSLVEMF